MPPGPTSREYIGGRGPGFEPGALALPKSSAVASSEQGFEVIRAEEGKTQLGAIGDPITILELISVRCA